MTALKCKLCGGNIEITGESHGICDSCGSEVTLPKIDDDKRADMYNRGNHFRQIGDFDRAYSAYEHIIADDESDAEAHWCLTLCRYGVEYVKDPRSGDYKPTVSRMSYERVLDDPDYLAALEASDEYTKELYRKEARKIDRIQSRYLEISRREAPYDVFICFKAQEENGQRTKGSVLAQEIYENLTEKGFKVFFSRITLEGMSGEEYEPYIFAALHSAKVLLLTADKPEQLEARWVKNEWSRYLSMMDKDRSKHIVPVFVDMSPYDFPPEIPTVQGQDMSRVGAMQDLVRGVSKLTGRTVETLAAAGAAGVTTGKLLIRAKQAVEDQDFEEANRLLEEVLNRDPENGEAYYFGLLAKREITALPSCPSKEQWSWVDDRYFKRAMQYGNEERKAQLLLFDNCCDQSRELVRAEELIKKENYRKAEQVLDEVTERTSQGGFRIGDEAAFHRLRKTCRDGIARQEEKARQQEELNRKIQEYHAQIDPARTYITRTLQEKHPDKAAKYEKILKKKIRVVKHTYDEGVGIIALFFSVLLLLSGIGIYSDIREEGAMLLLVWSAAFCIAGSKVFLGSFIGFKATIILTLVLSFGMGWAFDTFFDSYDLPFAVRVIFPTVGALTVLFGLYRTIVSIRWSGLYNSMKRYETQVLKPLEEEIREEVRDRWEKEIGSEHLVNLPGYGSRED
ncbi:MAG: TIR domain-containing protein [Lachnospiraceae bacterium]|nr:TIR domain-containing protein [Lachnospiraceae bacterium]